MAGAPTGPRGVSILSGLLPPKPRPDFSVLASILGLPEKRKVFVSYHHHGDQWYKDQLAALYCDRYDLLEDNSLERRFDSDDLAYVEREIREDYIQGASATVVLCGAQTWQRKFVDWEIYATLLKKSALIGICLPTLPAFPRPPRLHDNIVSGFAVWGFWNQMLATPGTLRVWIEQAITRSTYLIDNSRPKMRRNGEMREHP